METQNRTYESKFHTYRPKDVRIKKETCALSIDSGSEEPRLLELPHSNAGLGQWRETHLTRQPPLDRAQGSLFVVHDSAGQFAIIMLI